MKKDFIAIFFVVLSLNVFGQSLQYGINLNSGFFRYTGESAEKAEQINYNLDKEEGYTNNPYGNKYGLSYGISANIKRITRSNLRFGLDLGYEILRSRIDISAVWQHNENINETVSAKGKTILNSSFVNLFPSVGYQFNKSSMILFFDCGFDFGYCINENERGNAQSELRDYETSKERKTIEFDFRPRIQVGIQKHKIEGYIGYSKGMINYKSGFVGGTNEVYSEMIRVGLTYKL